MTTEISIDGTKFCLQGRPTYEGVTYRGKPVEGLLLNARMIQAIFDDECPETRNNWCYPDTGVWDPDRNTDDFCAHLPVYRDHGLLAVTVGMQGGGSIYTPNIYDNYLNSAFRPDGSFKQPYFDRLLRILKAADAAGMAVIVNYFYWKQVSRILEDATIYSITEKMTDWLLHTGYRNILIDVANESAPWWKREALEPANIHRIIEIVQQTTLNGRRLLASASTGGGDQLPEGRWLEIEDFALPHGNGLTPVELRTKLERLQSMPAFRTRPHPILINEDSVFVENLEAAVDCYTSWGYYSQGYGSDYCDRTDWKTQSRETNFDDLSGFQTVPVNWDINTPEKRAFFAAVQRITSGQDA
jgi:hypothetical protein